MTKPTMTEAGYKFVRQDGPGRIIVLEVEGNIREVWGANKNHAGYGFHWRNTDWEYVTSMIPEEGK